MKSLGGGVVGIGLLVALTSCGGGAGGAAKAARADQPTASSAMGGKCTSPTEDAEPWVIDLKADNRGALKAALDKGVVVVSYDCKELKILRSCQVRGNYEYSGTGFNEDTIRLNDADSVRATLSGGAALAGSLEADMQRGTKLDIAYAVVGERNTTLPTITRDQLGDGCKGATHFVATASIGAFVMRSTTDAKVGAAAEVFGQGASAQSSSSSSLNQSSGKRPVCQKATSQDQAPLNECDFPLKLRLVAIGEPGGAAAPAARAHGGTTTTRMQAACAAGTVRSNGVCVSEKTATNKVCNASQPSECEGECKKGNGPSCAIAGLAYEKGKGVTEDVAKAMQLYEAGCMKKDQDSCTGMGFLFSKGEGVPKDPRRAETIFREGCEKGNARACSGLGHQFRLAGDMNPAVDLFERACKLGYGRACFYAAAIIFKSGKDPKRAFWNYANACTGNDMRGCLAESVLLQTGQGAAANQGESMSLRDKAVKGLETACEKKDGDACENLGDYWMGNYDKSVKKPEKAIGYYANACGAGVDDACMAAGKIYEVGAPPYIPKSKDTAKAANGLYQVACMRGNLEGCKKANMKPPAGVAVKQQTKK
jgi:uncharacterized protein